MDKKPGRGGSRKGAGRPPIEPEKRKARVTVTLDPALVTWLKTQRQRPNEPMSQVVERLLQEKKEETQ